MYKTFFADMEWSALPLFALGLFLTVFVLMLVRTFAWKTKHDYEPLEQMPLRDGETVRHNPEVIP